jgi:hypothetical protein
MSSVRLLLVAGSVALGAIGLLSGCAPGGPARTAAAGGGHAARSALHTKGRAAKGDVGFLSCGGATLGQVAVMRSGMSTANLASQVHAQVRAQVTDSTQGHLVFLRGQDISPAALTGTPFTRVADVMAQSADPALRSCDYLLSDRPAAQPFVRAALTAAYAHGMAPSATALRAELQMVMVSDNPLRPGSLIVTMLIPGPMQSAATATMPALYGLNSIIVVMNRTGAAVTGIASGRW